MFALIGFDYSPRSRILFGNGVVSRLGEAAAGFGPARALVVTDPGIVAAGLVERGIRSLADAGVDYVVYEGVHKNPTGGDVDECVAFARGKSIDLIIGYGGGSSLDTAKGANFLLTNGGRIKDYRGYGKAQEPLLPMIAVPTTAGTGTEVQSFAVIGDDETHIKIACGDPSACPKVAVLDPELTITQPSTVTACSGLDAISHAVESAVTLKRNPISTLFSRESLRLTLRSFPRVQADPADLEARSEMLLGASWAGLAIENSMLGAAHAAANPLTAKYDTVHGAAVARMLPGVVRRNGRHPFTAELYRELVSTIGITEGNPTAGESVEILAGRLRDIAAPTVKELSADRPDSAAIKEMAMQAVGQMTARHNPVELSAEDFEELYYDAFDL